MWRLPDTWQWVQIGHFAFVTKLAGFEYTKFVKYVDDGDLPVLKAENAGPQGYRITDYSRVLGTSVSRLTRSLLRGGELIMVFVGAGTGNVAIVPNDEQFFLGPNVGMVRPECDAINVRYVELFLRSPKGKDLALAAVKAVAQPSLSMATIRQIPIALPSTSEQERIVSVLDELLSVIDRAETEIDDQLKKSDALRQSVLKKAFSGKLVAQDPNDEPASVLLKRIKGEKAEKGNSKKKNGRRKAA
jgi:type I restriction enzyme S subunit